MIINIENIYQISYKYRQGLLNASTIEIRVSIRRFNMNLRSFEKKSVLNEFSSSLFQEVLKAFKIMRKFVV